jgi:hypothetical protein
MTGTGPKPIGIAHLAPDLETSEDGELVCVGISGYWADQEQHLLENSPHFGEFRPAYEWAKQRAQTVFVRASRHGPLYWDGVPNPDTTRCVRLVLAQAEIEFDNDFGRTVA